MSKVFKILFDIIFIIMIIALGTYFVLRISGVANIYKVKTGSMENGIHPGDYILIYTKKNYKVGDIVTYKKSNYYITHRIIKKNGNKIITKGDANNTEDDAIALSDVIGKVIYIGGILNFLVNFKFAIAACLIGLYLLSYYFESKNKNIENSEGKG